MFVDSLWLTLAGMGSVCVFLLFLIFLMNSLAAIFTYIGPQEDAASDSDEETAAAIAAVLLRK